MHRLFLVLAFTGTFSLSAHAAGNDRAGQMLAERWCASCHLVTPEQTQASADVPSFRSIAEKSEKLKWLEGFLLDPHPPMPNLSLTRQEIQDLMAYFESLKQN
jgi:mono/diheme cytochrome c family protein